jgi:hypothetical protein
MRPVLPESVARTSESAARISLREEVSTNDACQPCDLKVVVQLPDIMPMLSVEPARVAQSDIFCA